MAEETFYRAEVRQCSRLSGQLVRLRLGPAPAATSVLQTSGVPDERVVLVLPGPEPVSRCYSVRSVGPGVGELEVDVVVHPGGVFSAWAEQASPGEPLEVGEPLGWYGPPADAGWQLLVADLTGLPALDRIVATTAARLPTRTLVEVVADDDRRPLPGATATWLSGSGNGVAASGLPAALAEVDWPAGPGYVWFAGESGVARTVRRQLRHDLGWRPERYRVLGYWRLGQEEWDARYARLGRGLEQVYADAVARGASSTDALEAYDDALEQVGL